jgi:hypothetical protein
MFVSCEFGNEYRQVCTDLRKEKGVQEALRRLAAGFIKKKCPQSTARWPGIESTVA